jgi:hypothetical protein
MLVALVTGSAAAWWVTLAVLPVVCAYVAVLFRTRRRMAEREINLAFFGSSNRAMAGLEDVFAARRDQPEPTGSTSAPRVSSAR